MKEDGTDDSERDLLIIVVIIGNRTSMDCFRIWVGIGSSSQDLGAERMINLRTSVSVVNAKQSNGCPQNIMSALNSPSPRFSLDIASWSRMVDIFPMKNLPNSFAISSLLSSVGKIGPQSLPKRLFVIL